MTLLSKVTVFLLALSLSNKTVAQVNLKEGLVAYYPFNGNPNDESGYKNNPSSANVTFTSDRFGNKNAACAFNGRSNFIQIPDNTSLRFRKSFSISTWVLVRGFYEGKCHGNRIIMKGSADYLKGSYMLTFDDNKSSNGSNCYTESTDKLRQSFYAAFASPVTNDYIVPGKWYLLTYTYDGTNALLYVNCKLQAKGVVRNADFSNSYDLFFGKMDNSQYPYWFNGLLDEVRLYNRVLTKDEISYLCNSTPEKTKTVCDEKDIASAKFGVTIKNCTTVSFDLSSVANKNLKEVKWYLGDGTTASKASLIHNYKRDGKYKVKVVTISNSGCKDSSTKEVNISKSNADFSFSESGEPGNIQFKAKNKSKSYEWNFGINNSTKTESDPTFLYNKSGSYTVRLVTENNTGCKDTIKKQINVTVPILITKVPAQKEVITTVPRKIPAIKLEKRENELMRNIIVINDSISIFLYDNGMIDGDSVTLIYNDEIIVARQLLTGKPLSFHLKIDPSRSKNELIMYADNLGSIPPNTALIVIIDGSERYTINLTSSKSRNAVVSFTLKER
ncbi:PKD domain-containing protein [Lacibacter sp. H407]|uniref:PKD domain-containing protein n=1 Tax=Lacibacter sp. H407 TaxID=3133423 RepID=UPI0030C2C103